MYLWTMHPLEVEMAIAKAGAVLIYEAPYSPHLNSIENYFSLYKAYLKRNCSRMFEDWRSVHDKALLNVDRDIGIKYFRHCGIPGSRSMMTEEEFKIFLMQQQLINMNTFN